MRESQGHWSVTNLQELKPSSIWFVVLYKCRPDRRWVISLYILTYDHPQFWGTLHCSPQDDWYWCCLSEQTQTEVQSVSIPRTAMKNNATIDHFSVKQNYIYTHKNQVIYILQYSEVTCLLFRSLRLKCGKTFSDLWWNLKGAVIQWRNSLIQQRS